MVGEELTLKSDCVMICVNHIICGRIGRLFHPYQKFKYTGFQVSFLRVWGDKTILFPLTIAERTVVMVAETDCWMVTLPLLQAKLISTQLLMMSI